MIATLGDLLDDIVVWPSGPVRSGTDTPARIQYRRGGSAANVAAMVARCGGRARFIGSVGDDDAGHRLVAQLAAEGVDVTVQPITGATTGTVVVLVDPASGERSFLTDRGAATGLRSAQAEWLDGVTALHVPGYSFTVEPLAGTAITLCRLATTRAIPISVDTSSTGALRDRGVESFLALLGELGAETVLANAEEASLLGLGPGRPAPGAALTIIRHGGEPTMIVTTDGTTTVVPVPPVAHVADTTGAGDGFAAGWLLARAESADPVAAAVQGHAVAARVLHLPGADLAPTATVIATPTQPAPSPHSLPSGPDTP